MPRVELTQDCHVFEAYLLKKLGDRFEITALAGCLDFAKAVGENCGAHSARARFERVCRTFDRLGISVLDCLLHGREPSGTILHERIKKNSEHLLYAAFAKVRAKALDVYVRNEVHPGVAHAGQYRLGSTPATLNNNHVTSKWFFEERRDAEYNFARMAWRHRVWRSLKTVRVDRLHVMETVGVLEGAWRA